MKKAIEDDPISLEVFRNALESIVDESFVGLMKSSYSSNIKERRDHSVALFDLEGRLVCQARESLPIHLGSMGGLIEKIIDTFEINSILPGDIFIGNDPYAAGGTHLPDLNFAMPLFDGNKVMCFTCNIAHHSDFGGLVPGSMAGGLTEIYLEGFRVPPIRLYKRGVLVEDVLALLLTNTRVPKERRGDLMAQIAACRVAERRFAELLYTYSADQTSRAIDALILRTESRLRTAISEIPDGIYHFRDLIDDDGAGSRDLTIDARMTVRGDELSIDFSESAPQAIGNINCTSSATRSAIAYAIKALLDPGVPNNQGAFNAVRWSAPPGSIVNARFPASVANRAQTVQRIIDVILGALSTALPMQAVAAANGANTTAVFSGIRPGTIDERYVYLETLGGGFGARATKDGKDGVQVHITNTSNLPVEVIESEYPLFVESYGLVADSGGAGRYRGGLGLRRVIRPVGHRCLFSGSGERFVHQPWGVFGGKNGSAGSFRIRRKNGSEARLPNKPSGVDVLEGDAVVITTPGAGGYGNPAERSAEDVQRDLASGKYTQEFVDAFYSSVRPNFIGKDAL